MQAADIHARIGGSWPQILAKLGIPAAALRDKPGPCPACGGTDRYRFDNRRQRGDYYCNGCGAGDGFRLLQRVYDWPFREARNRVMQAAGISDAAYLTAMPTILGPSREVTVAAPSDRVTRLRLSRCAIGDCDDAVNYLKSRGLWPLPQDCTLQAHVCLDYFQDGRRTGRYPGLLADVVDINGDLVTCHVTYLSDGKKLATHDPRKLLGPMTGRKGCAVRLMPARDILGLSEGIETSISASLLDGIPTWAALNTSLLSRFEPPPDVVTLRLYVDRDEAGLTAALKLMERLQGRFKLEIRIPPAPAKDWNDVLIKKRRLDDEGLSHDDE